MREVRLKGAYTDCIIPLPQNARKQKLIYSHRALVGAGVGRSVTKGSQKTLGSRECIRSILRGDVFPFIYLTNRIKDYNLDMYTLFCMNRASKEVAFKKSFDKLELNFPLIQTHGVTGRGQRGWEGSETPSLLPSQGVREEGL